MPTFTNRFESHLQEQFSNEDTINGFFCDEHNIAKAESNFVYQKFLKEHTCYDVMPRSCRVVVLSSELQLRHAFHILLENKNFHAAVWSPSMSSYVALFKIADFIEVILLCHNKKSEKYCLKSIGNKTVNWWIEILEKDKYFFTLPPETSLYKTVFSLQHGKHFEIPICDLVSGDILSIVTHKRILKFLHLFIDEIPKPGFLTEKLSETGLLQEKYLVVSLDSTLIEVLQLLSEHNITTVPVADREKGTLIGVFDTHTMTVLADSGVYHEVNMTVNEILQLCLNHNIENLNSKSCIDKSKKNLHHCQEDNLLKKQSLKKSLDSTLKKNADKLNKENSNFISLNNTTSSMKCKTSNTLIQVINQFVSSNSNILIIVNDRDEIQGVVNCLDIIFYITIHVVSCGHHTMFY